MINNTSDCEKCKYAKIDEANKARIKIICSYRDKIYYYGQHIECDDYEKEGVKND